MRENIKPLAESFKREQVHVALLRHSRFVIVSVRKRSFPVYEPASYFHEFFAPLPVARPTRQMTQGIKAFGDVEMHGEMGVRKSARIIASRASNAQAPQSSLDKRNYRVLCTNAPIFVSSLQPHKNDEKFLTHIRHCHTIIFFLSNHKAFRNFCI